jgi:hypothetical protein
MPAVRPRGNVSLKPLKWTAESVGREFKLAATSATKILNQGGAEPAADGTYSTEQVVACLFGDLRAERLRKERELVRKYSLENQITEASLLDRAALMKGFSAVADAMVSIISTSGLTRDEKENLQRELAGVPIICENVARAQTRLRRSKSGQTPEDGENES